MVICYLNMLFFVKKFPFPLATLVNLLRRYDMNGRFQMQGGKNWIFPKGMNANRFFWDSHWLEIWSNYFCPSMGPNGGSVAMDSVLIFYLLLYTCLFLSSRMVGCTITVPYTT
jgi:hypothetical protein